MGSGDGAGVESHEDMSSAEVIGALLSRDGQRFIELVHGIDGELRRKLAHEGKMESKGFIALMTVLFSFEYCDSLFASREIYRDLLRLAIRQLSCSSDICEQEIILIRSLVWSAPMQDELIAQYVNSINDILLDVEEDAVSQ